MICVFFSMDSDGNARTRNRSPSSISKWKLVYVFSILVLLLAISFSRTKTNYSDLFNLRSIMYHQKLRKVFHSNPIQKMHKGKTQTPSDESNSEPPFCVLWMAPFLSGGGYSSEAWSYILALNNYLKTQKNPRFRLSIEQHGDLENIEFWEGLPLGMRDLAFELYESECRVNETVVVCHSEPGAWYPPLFETLPCPPTGYGQFKVVIGRTMFETDRVNRHHVDRCNAMDFVWVPTDFHVDSFSRSGVDPLKVKKIVQSVDLEFFDPSKYEPLDFSSIATLVLGSQLIEVNLEERFVFLSVFKWEHRKGWDVLLRAYLKEFSGDDNVALYLLTNPYHSDKDFGNKIIEYVEGSDFEKPSKNWPLVYVVDEHVAQIDLPRLYKVANAFVLPSRGEGWGRPVVEAMAMSLPVIATNWSGPTEYLTDENSYPLPVDRMREVKEGPFEGHLWAEPSADKLQVLMRHVIRNPEEAKAKGKQARYDMSRKFSPEIVAHTVLDHLQQIIDKID